MLRAICGLAVLRFMWQCVTGPHDLFSPQSRPLREALVCPYPVEQEM